MSADPPIRHPYCLMCGEPADQARHDLCQRRATLEPPRYCPECGRRMIVQVHPTGWWATCSRHGEMRG